MKSEMTPVMISVFSYPEHSRRRASAIETISSLLEILDSNYGIRLPLKVVDGHAAHCPFSRFMMEFLRSCEKTYNHVDIHWLYHLNWIIKVPSQDILSGIRSLSGPDFQFLEPFLLEAQDNSESWRPAVGAQFFAIKRIGLKPGQGPWGANLGKYEDPYSVAIETTGCRESIFHEFLHQFGVSEGYNKDDTTTCRGCENCWMQREATRGKELCKRHQGELASFLQNIQSTSK